MFLGETSALQAHTNMHTINLEYKSPVFLIVLTLNIYTQVLKRSGVVWPFQQWSLVLLICHLLFLSSVSASPNTFYTFPTPRCANDTSWVSAGGKKQTVSLFVFIYVPTQPLSVYPCLCICICIEIPPGCHSHLYIPVQCQIALCNMRTIIARYIYNTISLSTVHIEGI